MLSSYQISFLPSFLGNVFCGKLDNLSEQDIDRQFMAQECQSICEQSNSCNCKIDHLVYLTVPLYQLLAETASKCLQNKVIKTHFENQIEALYKYS
jgi:hypothetical protein